LLIVPVVCVVPDICYKVFMSAIAAKRGEENVVDVEYADAAAGEADDMLPKKMKKVDTQVSLSPPKWRKSLEDLAMGFAFNETIDKEFVAACSRTCHRPRKKRPSIVTGCRKTDESFKTI
jgi:hypothetical protein